MPVKLPTTRHTLLERLADRVHPEWQEAWAEFVRLYGPHLLRWCIRWVGRSELANDVSAEVLGKLSRVVGRYGRTGRFRSWLYTICKRESVRVLGQKKWQCLPTTKDAVERLASSPAQADLKVELREPVKKTVIDQAFTNVHRRLERTGSLRTWDGYWLTAARDRGGQGLTDDEAACVMFPAIAEASIDSIEQRQRTSRALQNIRQYRRRVRDMLFEELELLGEDVSRCRAAKRGRPKKTGASEPQPESNTPSTD